MTNDCTDKKNDAQPLTLTKGVKIVLAGLKPFLSITHLLWNAAVASYFIISIKAEESIETKWAGNIDVKKSVELSVITIAHARALK